jgi:hypothetical protein
MAWMLNAKIPGGKNSSGLSRLSTPAHKDNNADLGSKEE